MPLRGSFILLLRTPTPGYQAARQYHREAASSRRSAQALKAAVRARSDADHAAAAAEVSDLQVLLAAARSARS